MKQLRKKHSRAFKAKVALAALEGDPVWVIGLRGGPAQTGYPKD